MGRPRYTVEDELIDKWLGEEMLENLAHLETEQATRVTITDELNNRTVNAAGADYEEALERACRKLGITTDDVGEEIDDD